MKVRGIVFAAGLAAAVVSLGFLLRWPIVTQIWPVAVSPLTYTFLSAYVLGAAVVLMWIATTGELYGLTAFGLTTATAFGSMTAVLTGVAASDPALVLDLGAVIALAVLGIVTFVFGSRQPIHDRRATRPWARVTCLVVCGLLLVVSVPLILRTPDVMPWSLDLDSGALIGCLFLGSAAYFAYGALRPNWPDAVGPLAALLAYDLVLTLPLIAHYPIARPQHMAVLLVYIAVLVSSAIVGIYVFLLERRTRVGTSGA